MSFVVTLERAASMSRREAFSRFVDFSTWSRWMPRSFKPLRGPQRALRTGDWIFLSIDFGLGFGMPSPARVTRVESDRSITWRGGIDGVLVGEHTFSFEDREGGGCLVRSHEEFTGLLVENKAGESRVRKLANSIGAEQADGFLGYYEKS